MLQKINNIPQKHGYLFHSNAKKTNNVNAKLFSDVPFDLG